MTGAFRFLRHTLKTGESLQYAYRIVLTPVGKCERKKPLGRPRRRWEDDIRSDLREIGWGGVDWMHLAQDRDKWRAVVDTVMNFRVT
jgi:hypothetical protein